MSEAERQTTRVIHPVKEGDDPGTLVYLLEGVAYVNVTNRCTAQCDFCTRASAPLIGPYDLRLSRDPSLDELRNALNGLESGGEIVFCGYGEPTLRLETILILAEELKARDMALRLNTNGHGNLIHGRDIVPELARFFDTVSVSLNAPDAETYVKLCRPRFGPSTFQAILDFTRRCHELIPEVLLTAVDLPELDAAGCRRVAAEIGVPLRIRRYYEHISESDRFVES